MRTHIGCRSRYFFSVACLLSRCVWLAAAENPDSAGMQIAAEFVRGSNCSGGVCAVVGRTDADLALALAGQGGFVVQALHTDAAVCEQVRRDIRARGMYGSVSADTCLAQQLPYTDNLVNLLVLDSYTQLAKNGLSLPEVLRVLTPLGTAYLGEPATTAPAGWIDQLTSQLRSLGVEDFDLAVVEMGSRWLRLKKPWPADIDQWTHYLHGPDGNPVARDRVVGPPKHYQWVAGPLWQRCHETDSSVSTLVTAQGRLFYIVDEAPISLPGDHPLPDEWFLAARDAFNGVPLWKVPIRHWGWREWKQTWFNTRPGDIPLNIQKRLVAVGDRVYVTLGYRAPVSELDGRTGEILQTYADTERTGEILVSGGTLFASLVEGDQIRIAAVDAASGKRRWVTEQAYRGTKVDYIKWKEANGGGEPERLNPSLNMATDGSIVALIDGSEVVAVDAQTGAEKWRAAFPLDPADLNAGGIQTQGNLWIGTMIVRDGVVLHASPNQLAAFAAQSGKLLWTQPKKYLQHLWYEWKDVFVIGGLVWTWSAELEQTTLDGANAKGKQQRSTWPRSVNGYDLQTGELKKQVPVGPIFATHHHHRCYRNKATERYILASRRGTEFVDLEQGQHTVQNWVRGTCHVGMMPANGLQYAPPHPCQCYIEEKLNGFNALAPEAKSKSRKVEESKSQEAEERLEKGPAFGKPGSPLSALDSPLSPSGSSLSALGSSLSDDWPAFRHDSLRTGAVATRVADDATVLWRVSVGRRVAPPVAVGDQVFVSLVDEHHVACLSVQDGRQLWEFAAGARVDSPPTYHEGRVLFGSADGCVYCLRASDGQLAWRFRAAPQSRLIGAFGQLESAWPVSGSVLVQNGVAYFAAGRSSELDGGILLYGVDASTGELRCQTKLEGPHYTAENIEQNYRLPLGALPDVLVGDGTKVYMRSLAFDGELKPQPGATELQTKSGFLDDSYFKRTPWTLGGEYARLIVQDSNSACYVRMFDSLRGLDPTVFFTPGGKGYLLFAKNLTGKSETWSQRVPLRIRAMVLTPQRLFVAGPPDVIDPQDPLGAFQGRKGGSLYVIDAATGQRLAEHSLTSPPVFNGAAAARGRLFLAAEDGSLTCLGKR